MLNFGNKKEDKDSSPLKIKRKTLEYAIIEALREGKKDSVTCRIDAAHILGKKDVSVGRFYNSIQLLRDNNIVLRRVGNELIPERGNRPHTYFSLIGGPKRSFEVEQEDVGFPDIGGFVTETS